MCGVARVGVTRCGRLTSGCHSSLKLKICILFFGFWPKRHPFVILPNKTRDLFFCLGGVCKPKQLRLYGVGLFPDIPVHDYHVLSPFSYHPSHKFYLPLQGVPKRMSPGATRCGPLPLATPLYWALTLYCVAVRHVLISISGNSVINDLMKYYLHSSEFKHLES